jgi:NTE family protein
MPSSRIPSPLQLIRKGESIHSNHGLLRTVIEFLGDRDTFEELAVPFQCVATDVDLATEQWFDSGRLIEPILASAALPAVYPMVHIAGRRYLDGGVVNNVPLARAVELGAKKIFVLHVGLHGRPHAEVRRPLDAALIAYWIARNNRFQRDLAALPRSIEVVVLPPGDRPEVRYDDFDQTEDLMTQGYERAATYLDELDAAEAKEPRLAERLRLDMFKTAEWRPGARRRAADGTNTDGVPADGGIEDPADTNDEAPEVMS